MIPHVAYASAMPQKGSWGARLQCHWQQFCALSHPARSITTAGATATNCCSLSQVLSASSGCLQACQTGDTLSANVLLHLARVNGRSGAAANLCRYWPTGGLSASLARCLQLSTSGAPPALPPQGHCHHSSSTCNSACNTCAHTSVHCKSTSLYVSYTYAFVAPSTSHICSWEHYLLATASRLHHWRQHPIHNPIPNARHVQCRQCINAGLHGILPCLMQYLLRSPWWRQP